jgi:hypothetical protein
MQRHNERCRSKHKERTACNAMQRPAAKESEDLVGERVVCGRKRR